jgi:hypothetical protein
MQDFCVTSFLEAWNHRIEASICSLLEIAGDQMVRMFLNKVKSLFNREKFRRQQRQYTGREAH